MERNISVEERIKRAEERYYNTLNRDYNNIKDEVNHGVLIKSGEKDLEALDQNDEYIYAYMLDSKDIENYEKQLEASLAKIVNEQKRLIETNATLEELE